MVQRQKPAKRCEIESAFGEEHASHKECDSLRSGCALLGSGTLFPLPGSQCKSYLVRQRNEHACSVRCRRLYSPSISTPTPTYRKPDYEDNLLICTWCFSCRVLELLQFLIIFFRLLKKCARTRTHQQTLVATCCRPGPARDPGCHSSPRTELCPAAPSSTGNYLNLARNTGSSANTRCFRALHMARRSVCVCFAVKESIRSPSKHARTLSTLAVGDRSIAPRCEALVAREWQRICCFLCVCVSLLGNSVGSSSYPQENQLLYVKPCHEKSSVPVAAGADISN